MVEYAFYKNMVENISSESTTNNNVYLTTEGIAVTYGSLVITAMLPIIFGSIRSLKLHKLRKVTGEKGDILTKTEALFCPVILSVLLCGLYMIFQVSSKKHINNVLTAYFLFHGIIEVTHLLNCFVNCLIPATVPKILYHMHFTKGTGKQEKDLINCKFSTLNIACLIISSAFGVWYLLEKHWIANNVFGLAFAVNGVQLLHLNNIVTGCILLTGLLIYDIFWVFGTNIMGTVAKSFEAPIKLIFPQDLIMRGVNVTNFAMLGLGDIIIPGIFIALMLRFDHSTKRKSRIYFYSTLIAYFLSLLATIFVMHVFKHAQPALLYLVPACMGTPLLLALFRGELKPLFAYEDYPEEITKEKNQEIGQCRLQKLK